MESRLPTTISASMVLHAAGIGVWLYMGQLSKHDQTKVLSNVELMIAVRPGPNQAPTRGPAASSPDTWNFLKMALPTVPIRAPMEVQAPKEERRARVRSEKLLEQNRTRMHKALELEAGKELSHHTTLEALNAANPEPGVTHAQLAEAPRLEEVGRRRASKAAIAMDDALVEAQSSKSSPRAQALSEIAAAQAPSESHGAAAMEALTEAAAPVQDRGRLAGSNLSSLLPSEPAISHSRMGPLSSGLDGDGAAAPARHQVEEQAARKKTAMIEGPLKRRRVLHYEIPKFPAWAQAQGVLEAIVRIRFSVAPSGEVLEEMRIVQTSGYGELDRLAMESLRQWTFEAKPDDSGNEWGIITFRFVME